STGPAPSPTYPLSLHDALPILATERNTLWKQGPKRGQFYDGTARAGLLTTLWRGTGFGTVLGDFDNDGWSDIAVVNGAEVAQDRSEEHTSELQSRGHLVCRLLL